jgi:hypothetical protein
MICGPADPHAGERRKTMPILFSSENEIVFRKFEEVIAPIPESVEYPGRKKTDV